jgi:hypothetical protein
LILLAEQDDYEEVMEELVDRVAGNVGIAATRGTSRGNLPRFLATECPADTVEALACPAAPKQRRLHTRKARGRLFGATGGLMGVGSRLMPAGLSMSEIPGVTRVLMAYAR